MQTKQSSGLGETLRTVLYAVLIAFGVRTFLYEPFNIPSGSMIPTLLIGDYLFVSKFSYGYSRYTIAFGLPLFDGRILGGTPERGDVIVFKQPNNTSVDFIKRLIGLPGDTVQVRAGILHINGVPVEREMIEAGADGAVLYWETLPGGVRHVIREEGDNRPSDDTMVYTVPAGHYFFMGDNRDNSSDSRVLNSVGYVPEENLVGRAEFLWFSLDNARFWEVWKWPTALRLDRMFQGVD